jgi:hypothetical protein
VIDQSFARNVAWLLFGHVAELIQHSYSLFFAPLLDMSFDKNPDRHEIFLLEGCGQVFGYWRIPRITRSYIS